MLRKAIILIGTVMLPFAKRGFACPFLYLSILCMLFGYSVFAQDAPDIRIDSVSRSDYGRYLYVDYSIDQAGVFEIEYSKDLVDWHLWALHLIKISSESGASRGFSFSAFPSGSTFFRIKPRDRTALRTELAANRSKWEALGILSYEYETNETCYCDPDTLRTVRVSVEEGVVTSVVAVGNGEVLENEGYETIDEQFDRVEEAFDFPADFVTIRYDPLYGYPISAEFDWWAGIADDERGFQSRLLRHIELSSDTGLVQREDAYSVSGIEVAGTHLQADVSFSGGCALHAFSLSMDPDGFMESNPVQINLFLRHDDKGDSCESIVQESIEFDLSAVRALYEEQFQTLGDIRLNIHSVIGGVSKEEASVLLEN